MVNYQNGKIYKLVNNVDDEIYIGSTCNPLSKRKSEHKKNSKLEKCQNRPIYKHLIKIGWENVEIILIETYSCENKDELHKRERYWIDELKPSLNKVLPGRTEKEWRDDNRTELLVKKREYYKNNIEVIRVKDKKRYEKNREEISEKYAINRDRISEKGKIKITCDCGSIVRKDTKARHQKTQRHKDYLETLNQ